MSLKQLKQVQLGNESTRGTAVAQTKELAGVESISISDYFATIANKEMGYLAPSRGNVIVSEIGGSASIEGRLNFDQFPILLDSLFGTATPSGSDPYTYAYNAPNTATATRRFFTLAHGDSTDAKSLTGALVSSLELTFAPKDYIKYTAELVGHHVEDDSLDSVASSTVAFPNNADVTISMGDYGGSVSALDCNVRSATLSINTNTTNHFGVGNLAACQADYGEMESTLTLVFNDDYATLLTVFDGMLSTTPTVQRKEFQINVSGSGNDDIDIDWSGYLAEPGEIYGDEDGVATLELVFNANFDSSTNLTSWCDVTVVLDGEATMF